MRDLRGLAARVLRAAADGGSNYWARFSERVHGADRGLEEARIAEHVSTTGHPGGAVKRVTADTVARTLVRVFKEVGLMDPDLRRDLMNERVNPLAADAVLRLAFYGA